MRSSMTVMAKLSVLCRLRQRPNWVSLSRHSSRSRQRAKLAQAGSPAARKSSSRAGSRPAAASRAITSRSSRVNCTASSR